MSALRLRLRFWPVLLLYLPAKGTSLPWKLASDKSRPSRRKGGISLLIEEEMNYSKIKWFIQAYLETKVAQPLRSALNARYSCCTCLLSFWLTSDSSVWTLLSKPSGSQISSLLILIKHVLSTLTVWFPVLAVLPVIVLLAAQSSTNKTRFFSGVIKRENFYFVQETHEIFCFMVL